MPSTEYALLKDGSIFTVVTTSLALWEVALKYGEYEVKPLHLVPMAVREKYEFWAERP